MEKKQQIIRNLERGHNNQSLLSVNTEQEIKKTLINYLYPENEKQRTEKNENPKNPL